MNKDYFQDKLRRTLLMEEAMAKSLLGAAKEAATAVDVPSLTQEQRDRVVHILGILESDTARHRELNVKMLAQLSGGSHE